MAHNRTTAVMTKRKSTPKNVETEVLTKCRRRCCLCFYINGNYDEVRGQIAHIDHNPSNADTDNLVFLCLEHHDQYDSKTSQSKGLTTEEVKLYRNQLHKDVLTISPQEPPQPVQAAALRVGANPTRKGKTQLAQIQIENTSKHAVRVTSWYYMWREFKGESSGAVQTEHSSLPVLLHEREAHEFLGEVLDCDVEAIEEIGVIDSDKRRWSVPPDEIARFVRRASQHRFPDHLLDDEDRLPEDTAGQNISIKVRSETSTAYPHERLVFTIINNGTAPVHTSGVDLSWEYDPPRDCRSSDSGPKVQEVNGSLNTGNPYGNCPLEPGCSRDYSIDGEWAALLTTAAAPDVPKDSIKATVCTAKKGAWVLTEDGLPEAILHVAKSVAKAQIQGLT